MFLCAVAGPAAARHPPGDADNRTVQNMALPRLPALFKQGDFDELEVIYAKAAAAYQRDGEGQLHTEFYFSILPPVNAQDELMKADQLTQAWVQRSPDSLLAEMARANTLIRRAQAIGNGKDWASIDRLSAQAYQALMKVKAKGQKDCNWHTLLFYVADLQGWKLSRLQAAIKTAVDADPYPIDQYVSAARALAMSSNQDPKLLAWLVDLAVQKTRSTEGLSMYARIYLGPGGSWFPDVRTHPFGANHMDWAKLNAGLTDWYARFPQPPVRSEHAALACVIQDRPVAEALMEAMGPSPAAQYMFERHGGKALYPRCKAWLEQGRVVRPKV
jgi:hypothetical protein